MKDETTSDIASSGFELWYCRFVTNHINCLIVQALELGQKSIDKMLVSNQWIFLQINSLANYCFECGQ